METSTDYYFKEPQSQRIALLWEILRFIRLREVGFVPAKEGATVRFQNIGAMPYLEERLKETRQWDFHFFASIQKVQHTDGKGHYLDLRDNWQEYTFGWDFVVDIDGRGATNKEKIDDAYKKAVEIEQVYYKYGLPYSIIFSGRGYHFWLFHEDIKKHFKASDYGTVNKELTKFIAEKAKVNLDTAVASKDRTLIRVPYSLNPRSGLIALPLTDQQFIDFDPTIVTPDAFYEMDIPTKPPYRGMLKRKGTLEDFIEDFKNYQDGLLKT